MSFDPKLPKAIIVCTHCKKPLWDIEIRSAHSHRITKFDKESRNWDEKNPDCPKCGRQFFELKDGQPKYKIKSLDGKSFTL